MLNARRGYSNRQVEIFTSKQTLIIQFRSGKMNTPAHVVRSRKNPARKSMSGAYFIPDDLGKQINHPTTKDYNYSEEMKLALSKALKVQKSFGGI
jgi:hypothetical protein